MYIQRHFIFEKLMSWIINGVIALVQTVSQERLPEFHIWFPNSVRFSFVYLFHGLFSCITAQEKSVENNADQNLSFRDLWGGLVIDLGSRNLLCQLQQVI